MAIPFKLCDWCKTQIKCASTRKCDELVPRGMRQVRADEVIGDRVPKHEAGDLVDRSRVMRIVLPFPPSTNTYYRKFRNRMVICAAGLAYKKAVKRAWELASGQMFDGPVALDVVLIQPDKRRRDLDNFAGKALLDSLKGLAYKDDVQVWGIFARWFLDDQKKPAVVKGGVLHLEVKSLLTVAA